MPSSQTLSTSDFIIECTIEEGESSKVEEPTLLGDLNPLMAFQDPNIWVSYMDGSSYEIIDSGARIILNGPNAEVLRQALRFKF